MDIEFGRQMDVEELTRKNISLFIFAGNHEKRVFNAYDKLSKQNRIDETIVLCYDESFQSTRHKHIEYRTIKYHQEISRILDSKLEKIKDDQISLVIDYSCMTKSWYFQ